MASKATIGSGVALAGLGGLAAAAISANSGEQTTAAKTTAQPVVETQTVIVRKVEHRTIRLHPKHHAAAAKAAAAAPAPAPANVLPATQPVVQAAPAVQVAPVRTTTPRPIHTRTSSGHGTSGGDDSHEHEGTHSAAEQDD